jgi:hypothetical protein
MEELAEIRRLAHTPLETAVAVEREAPYSGRLPVLEVQAVMGI